MGLNCNTVGRWRNRYLEHGVQGLLDELRPGRPQTYDDEKVGCVHWSGVKAEARML